MAACERGRREERRGWSSALGSMTCAFLDVVDCVSGERGGVEGGMKGGREGGREGGRGRDK